MAPYIRWQDRCDGNLWIAIPDAVQRNLIMVNIGTVGPKK